MTRILLFVSAILILILGIYFLKRANMFMPLMNAEDSEENIQFLHRFAKFYIMLSFIGFFVAFMDLNFFSLIYILGSLIISMVFTVMLSKKIH